ncbi:hypothetical protein PanWU01x14_268820, partial [Parasponia andersonii]
LRWWRMGEKRWQWRGKGIISNDVKMDPGRIGARLDMLTSSTRDDKIFCICAICAA